MWSEEIGHEIDRFQIISLKVNLEVSVPGYGYIGSILSRDDQNK